MEPWKRNKCQWLTKLPLFQIEFSRNTKSWQCWHFCTTSNGNKLETVENLKTILHLWLCFSLKLFSNLHCQLYVLRENSNREFPWRHSASTLHQQKKGRYNPLQCIVFKSLQQEILYPDGITLYPKKFKTFWDFFCLLL